MANKYDDYTFRAPAPDREPGSGYGSGPGRTGAGTSSGSSYRSPSGSGRPGTGTRSGAGYSARSAGAGTGRSAGTRSTGRTAASGRSAGSRKPASGSSAPIRPNSMPSSRKAPPNRYAKKTNGFLTGEAKNLAYKAAIFFGIFIFFTLMVKVVGVDPIGPEGSKVGFAGINEKFHNKIGYRPNWYYFSEGMGYIALMVMGAFAGTGLFQLIKRKDLKAVDKDIYLMAGFYVVVLIVYVLFEKAAINYRPYIFDAKEGLEASYPSSHTILAFSVFGSAMIWLRRRTFDEMLLKLLKYLTYALIVLTVFGRLMSGVHWFTDIVGGVLISLALVYLYETGDKKLEDFS